MTITRRGSAVCRARNAASPQILGCDPHAQLGLVWTVLAPAGVVHRPETGSLRAGSSRSSCRLLVKPVGAETCELKPSIRRVS